MPNFEIEKISAKFVQRENYYEIHFSENTRQTINGRYVVRILFRNNISIRRFAQQTKKCLYLLKRNLARQTKIYSRLLPLCAFLDEDEIIKDSRLRNAFIHFQKKHSVVLPSKHPFTEIIIRNEHIRLLHVMPIIALCRERYWSITNPR